MLKVGNVKYTTLLLNVRSDADEQSAYSSTRQETDSFVLSVSAVYVNKLLVYRTTAIQKLIYLGDSAPRPPSSNHVYCPQSTVPGYMFVADSVSLAAVNVTQLTPTDAVLS